MPAEARGQFDLELHGRLTAALNMATHENVGGGGGTNPGWGRSALR